MLEAHSSLSSLLEPSLSSLSCFLFFDGIETISKRKDMLCIKCVVHKIKALPKVTVSYKRLICYANQLLSAIFILRIIFVICIHRNVYVERAQMTE